MSTQINASTQLGTIGVDEVLDEAASPRRRAGAPSRRAARPASGSSRARSLNVAAVIVFFCSVFPVYWMINMSLTPANKIISRSPSLVPLELTWQNYVTAWTREAAPGQTDFPHGLMTSIDRHDRACSSPRCCSRSSPRSPSRASTSRAGAASSSRCSSSR